MIYLENNTKQQKVYIPRYESIIPTGSTGHSATLQTKNYTINENGLTVIHPDLGYDGISGGTIEVYVGASSGVTLEHLNVDENGEYVATGDTAYSGVTVSVPDTYQDGFNDGYNSGYTEGYASGMTDGFTSGQTEGYAEGYEIGNAEGYISGQTVGYTSGVTDGYTSGYTAGYNDGYTSGITDGYTSGYTVGYNAGYSSGTTEGYASGTTDGYASGETHQKSLLISTAVTSNGTYERENGFSSVTVNIELSSLSAGTITGNGQYNYSIYDIPEPERPNGWSQINFSVNVDSEYLALVATAVTTTANQSVKIYYPYTFYGKSPNIKRVRIEELNIDVTASTYVFATPGVYTLSYYTSNIAPVLLMQDEAFTDVKIMADSIDYISFASPSNSSLSSVTFNTGTTVIYIPSAFCNFTLTEPYGSLHDVVIPDSVRNIGDRAFSEGCLRSVVIGNSVRSIAYKAFSSNSNLSSITSYSTTAPDLGSLVFDGISSSGTLYVPSSSISSYTNNWLPKLPSGWTVSAL